MKRVAIIIILIVAFSTASYGEKLFYKGFKNVDWGTHKENLPDLGLSKKSIKKIYKKGEASVLFMEGKGNLKMEVKGKKLLSIFFRFRDSVFYGVDLVFRKKDRKSFYTVLRDEYGKPSATSDYEDIWEDKEITVKLTDREIMVSKK